MCDRQQSGESKFERVRRRNVARACQWSVCSAPPRARHGMGPCVQPRGARVVGERSRTTPRVADPHRRSFDQTRPTKLLPQNGHRRVASSRSRRSRLPRAEFGSPQLLPTSSYVGAGAPVCRKALRVHPTHVRTLGVARRSDVTQQRAVKGVSGLWGSRDGQWRTYPKRGRWGIQRCRRPATGSRRDRPDRVHQGCPGRLVQRGRDLLWEATEKAALRLPSQVPTGFLAWWPREWSGVRSTRHSLGVRRCSQSATACDVLFSI